MGSEMCIRDRDGDLDIVSASPLDDTIAWYENNGGVNPTFTAADIATNADEARNIHIADLDGDGDQDLMVSAVEIEDLYGYSLTTNPAITRTQAHHLRQILVRLRLSPPLV